MLQTVDLVPFARPMSLNMSLQITYIANEKVFLLLGNSAVNHNQTERGETPTEY